MKYLVVVVLLCGFFDAFADDGESFQYTGFRQGQMGVGAMLGIPAGLRFQRFLSWRSAVFVSGGYSIDRFVTADANYSFYVLAQEDPWLKPGQVGHILYNVFGGFTVGFPLKSGDKSRLGIRAGAAFEYLFPNTTWTLRAEVAPVIFVSGQTAAGLQSGIVVSYYFDGSSKKSKGSKPQ